MSPLFKIPGMVTYTAITVILGCRFAIRYWFGKTISDLALDSLTAIGDFGQARVDWIRAFESGQRGAQRIFRERVVSKTQGVRGAA